MTDTDEQLTPEEVAAADRQRAIVRPLYKSIQQREWLAICRGLDETKEEITEREELLMPALAWIAQKRNNGSADWDRILDMTDEEIVAAIGIDVDDDDPADDPKGLTTTATVGESVAHSSSSPAPEPSQGTSTTY